MTDPLHTEPVEVTQADKDAAAWALDWGSNSTTWENLHASHVTPDKKWRANRVAQAFARHRTAAEAASLAREDALRGLIGDAYETLKRIEQGADEALVAAAAKEACDKIDAALTASEGGE